MESRDCFPEDKLAQLRLAAADETRLAAIYLYGGRRTGDCDLAALFTETLPWPERLELELAVAQALDLESVELMDLRRMPLVTRYDVINRGVPICVCRPDAVAMFIEDTVARYSAFYPLLEALYWKVETKPLSEDMLGEAPANGDP